MNIATWNVNSLTVRLPHVLQWLASSQTDVLGLQELKLEDTRFPQAALAAHGFAGVFTGQKTYNGVAILSRLPLHDVQYNLPNYPDSQRRLIAATVQDKRIVCVYVPNGASLDSPKYGYKLDWLRAFSEWLSQEQQRYPKLVVLGDFNIAPNDLDVYDPSAWAGHVLVSTAERDAFRQLLDLGFTDALRLHQPETAGLYTWWDYRLNAFRRNLGLRIDHVLLSDALISQCRACQIDQSPRGWERPSDHAPVWISCDDP